MASTSGFPRGNGIWCRVSVVCQQSRRLSADDCLWCSALGRLGYPMALWQAIKIPHDRSATPFLRLFGRGAKVEALVFRTSFRRSSGDATNRPLMGAICCPLGWWDDTLPPPARRQVL